MSKARKVKFALFIFALFLTTPPALFAQDPITLTGHDLRQAATDSYYTTWDKTDVPGWAVGIIQDGKLIYQAGYGMANVEEGVPLSSATMFNIASNSKQFTAACIALLVIRGEISLDDDIRSYIPELPDYGSKIKIRHLVHQMSGLEEYSTTMYLQWVNEGERYGYSIDNQDALDIIVQQDSLLFEPGEKYSYNNTNYQLLTEIVERVSGQTLREFADENIFRPLGMNHTFFKDDTLYVSNYAADYHVLSVEPIGNRPITYSLIEADEIFYRYYSCITGASGLLTTIEDLYRWDQNFYSNSLEGGARFTDMMLSLDKFNNGTWNTYGFGLRHTYYRGLYLIHHSGNIAGFQSYIRRFPEQKLTVIQLANYEWSPAAESSTTVAINYFLYGPKPAGCDINQDGKLSMQDVVAFLLLAQSDSTDPRLDWNNDEKYDVYDAAELLSDIWSGNCPENLDGSIRLASATEQAPSINVEALSEEQIAYLEQMMDKLDLTEDQEAEYLLVLYGETGAAKLPKAYSLEQNSPNPFNPSTTISYTVPEGSQDHVILNVYDLRGRLVRNLVEAIRGAGTYSVYWDGTDESGRQVASGVYFYRMQAGDFTQTRKMVVLK